MLYLYIIYVIIGIMIDGKEVHFHLPELQKYFVPYVGDVMLIKANYIQHATHTKGPSGQFALCVYM